MGRGGGCAAYQTDSSKSRRAREQEIQGARFESFCSFSPRSFLILRVIFFPFSFFPPFLSFFFTQLLSQLSRACLLQRLSRIIKCSSLFNACNASAAAAGAIEIYSRAKRIVPRDFFLEAGMSALIDCSWNGF